MKVRAIRIGYYGNRRQREGTIFTLSDPKHFSEKWMSKELEVPKQQGKAPKTEVSDDSQRPSDLERI